MNIEKKNKALLKDIESRIEQVEERLEAGKDILAQCRKQVAVLKRKLKEYKHIKQQVINHYGSAADGNL